MSGQVAKYGAAAALNYFCYQANPVVAAAAPASWIPGQIWINTSSGNSINVYDGTSPYNAGHWGVVGSLYLALLTSDPSLSGAGGTPSALISDLVEDLTTGYARQVVTFSQITQAGATLPPAAASNTANIVFGPYTANQALAVQWAALVTAVSGTVGLLLYTWTLDVIEQVLSTQSITIPAGSLVLNQQ